MISRFVGAVIDAQQRWADPFGEWAQRVLRAIFSPVRWLKDLLHGTWLGHALHPFITDVPVGAFTVAVVLDVWTRDEASFAVRTAADITIAVGLLGMLGAILTGLADYTDTDAKPARRVATLHGLLMLVAFVLYAIALGARLAQPPEASRTGAVALSFVAYAIVLVAAYLSGDLVFKFGNMVDRHAFRSFGAKWVALDVTQLAENTPTQAKADAQSLLVVRRGERVFALHDTCAHAGCDLSGGTVVGDAIECPCHGSRFRLDTGRVVRGPATFDQPAYEVRSSDGRIEVRSRRASGD